jgi:hypothetical protein
MENASLAYWRKPKGPSFRILPLETDKQNSTPRGSLLAVMNADREQPIKDFELTGRWRFTSVDRRFFLGINPERPKFPDGTRPAQCLSKIQMVLCHSWLRQNLRAIDPCGPTVADVVS